MLTSTVTKLKETSDKIIPDLLNNSKAIKNTFINFNEAEEILNKKSEGRNGQQRGLRGIGAEYWIIQNNGNTIKTFRNFKE